MKRKTKSELEPLRAEYIANPNKMSQRKYAEHLGVSTSTISRWKHEARETEPTQQKLVYEASFGDIADKLGISVYEARNLYGSAIEKMTLIINNDANYGKNLWEWLDTNEQRIMDHQFM